LEPLAGWVERAVRKDCDVLIANVMEGQPYVTAGHRLLAEHGEDVIRGLAIIGRAIGARRLMLAVDRRWTDDYRSLIGPAQAYKVARIALTHKYPTGADPLLVKVLTRRQMPVGAATTDVGAAVVNASACFAAYRWVACGQPATHRVVTVSGERIAKGGNFWTPLGMSCQALAGTDDRLIHGGPMVGLRCPAGAAVGATTDAVLAVAEAPASSSTPCIRCGWCTDLCPSRLNVAALNDDFELSLLDHARRSGTVACIECGICSYVCPARLPLTRRVQELKKAIARGPGATFLDGHGGRR